MSVMGERIVLGEDCSCSLEDDESAKVAVLMRHKRRGVTMCRVS